MHEAMRAQMPQFGISSNVQFAQISVEGKAFSLGFEEGLWNLPWYDIHTKSGQYLETLTIQFVYAGGMIHSVTAQPKYEKGSSRKPLQVEYEWIAQESVDVLAGASVMFLATIVMGVFFLIQACGISDDDGDDTTSNNGHYEPVTFMGASVGMEGSGVGVPKYD
jgi:hypothetical protein